MRNFIFCTFLITLFATLHVKNAVAQDTALHKLFDQYYEERLYFFPLEATLAGDKRFNDQLRNDGSITCLAQLNDFYNKYLLALKKYKREKLSKEDQVSYDLLQYTLETAKEGLLFHQEYLPVNQFWSLPAIVGILGAGNSAQPFNTIKDYEDWLKRIDAFKIWVDTAVSNFNKGIAAGVVLPKALVVKTIPQMEKLAETDSSKSIFYGPVRNFPPDFTPEQKADLLIKYHVSVSTVLIPAYRKLTDYLSNDYLQHARSSSGYNAFPNGDAWYRYLVRLQTTTDKTPEEIYKTGLKETERIAREMEALKTSVGFNGSLAQFYSFIRTDPRSYPFKSPEEVLNAYRSVQRRIEPNLHLLFSLKPKTQFEIRQTESFRAASISVAQYLPGSPDGKRPGIMNVPVNDATKFPAYDIETIFIHEGIPGHHYQISLKNENTGLPLFRRHLRTTQLNAFTEGWALYAETLGKSLGLFTDPYQYMGALVSDMHRAVRLVVDVGLHTGKMSREEAIKYMTDRMPHDEQFAITEIERYMANSAQALSYKIGELKIVALRDKYKIQLKDKFDLKKFHDAILLEGALPLGILETYMDDWAQAQE